MNYLEIEKEMTKTYNAIASKYEKEAKEDWKDKKYINKFLKYIKHNASILDIGCGTGELLKFCSDIGLDTTGIDISKEMVNISRKKVSNANVIQMSLYDIDKLEEKFDAVTATFLLVHIPKEKINEVIRKINGFEILESEEVRRINKSNVGFIIARKQKRNRSKINRKKEEN